MAESRSKIFQIGFNKCGTRSIELFFKSQGFRCVHWDRGRLARTVFKNLEAGHSLIRGYEEYDVFTDMECLKSRLQAFKLYPQFAQEFPGALFILNTRDREAWIRSRMRHQEGIFARKWKAIYRVKTDEELAQRWREDWDKHHAEVQAFFAETAHRLVVFNIEQDSPMKLVKALPEARLKPKKLRHIGSSERTAARRAAAQGKDPAEAA